MVDAISFLAPLVVFLTAVVAIFGPSRIAGSSGLGSITVFGWSSLALAAASLVAALFLAHTKQQELAAARLEQMRFGSLARVELTESLDHLEEVLHFAALIPFITQPSIGPDLPKSVSYAEKNRPANYLKIDLQSDEVLNVLENVFLTPEARIFGAYSSPVPFGTDIRPVLTIIAEETAIAIQKIEKVTQIYSEATIGADLHEAANSVRSSPFVKHAISIRESWEKRSRMENSDQAESLNFRFLNSGIEGGSKEDFLTMLKGMRQMREALGRDS